MDLLESLFFVSVGFCSAIFCNENNVAMEQKYLCDCDTGRTTQLFLTKSCAEIIASGASCLSCSRRIIADV